VTYRVVRGDRAFERETDDWITAHELAGDHESEHSSHRVRLHGPG